jgi:hypothetical protein
MHYEDGLYRDDLIQLLAAIYWRMQKPGIRLP